eukprot:401100_1
MYQVHFRKALTTTNDLFYKSVRFRHHHNIKWHENHDQTIRSRRHNLKGRVKKFNQYIWHLRGMSVDEALIQMRFARSPKGWEFFSLFKNAQNNAVNVFGLNPDHLMIHRLNCGRARQPKMVKHRGRDKHQFFKLKHSHLFCKVKEDKAKAINSFRGYRGQRLLEATRPKELIVID